ncbi:DUF2147 domain-containing protein [Halosquirtibacter xylanolyticus]|uniref:DUF2147 domain-containing protein n=1 Tax=Halosquirtibacter xylanolyticus TaxID=3374599 RepID=UPI003748F1E5|nr:DUF2147 domain-containing protein [Prolixibacteraceae bacterium]
MKKLMMALICLLVTLPSIAQEITGIWQTIDDKTNKPKSDVEITIKDGKLFGQVVGFYNSDPNYDPLCKECKGDLHNQPIKGLFIVDGLTKKDGVWVKDDGILDPESGKTYDVKLWQEDGELQVRGYIGFFYRTQTWVRKK